MSDTRLDAAIESRAARFSARFIVPALLTVLVGIVSYVGGRALDEQGKQGEKIAGMAVDIANIRGELTGFKYDAERSRENIGDKLADLNNRLDRQASFLGKLTDKVDDLSRQ